MAVTTNILKIGRLDAVVKFTGTANTTLTLPSLIKSDEVLGAPSVSIHGINWSVASANDKITITRNGVVLYNLIGSGHFKLTSYTDATFSTSDIVVDLGVNAGTLILELRKLSGYTEPDQQHPVA